MQLHIDSIRIKKIALFGTFLAYILMIGMIERMIPLDGMVPGMRLGLANLVIVIALYIFSFRDTLLLVIMKCVMMSMLSGNIIALFYSMSGSLASLAVMYALIKINIASPVGVSVVGAALHNVAQIIVARFILGTWGVLIYLPFLLLAGTVSGALIGILAKKVLPMLHVYFEREKMLGPNT